MTTKLVVVMGVSGSGKTTVGRLLAERLRWRFYDADDFHSPENVAKMASGQPLTDADRAGWITALADLLRERATTGGKAVLACSALKAAYRQALQVDPMVGFVYLRGTYQQIYDRLNQRSGHFMKPQLLATQFATLEEPVDGITVDIDQSVQDMVTEIVEALGG